MTKNCIIMKHVFFSVEVSNFANLNQSETNHSNLKMTESKENHILLKYQR